MSLSIEYRDSISVDDYNALREAVGWERLCSEQAQLGLDNSAFMISCYDGGDIAGFTRIIWDRGHIAYLADVMVLPRYQGMGIGRHMVQAAVDFMKAQLREGWNISIVLRAAKGKEGFYEKFGFREKPNADSGAGMDLTLR